MERKKLIEMLVFLTVGFVCGFLTAGLLAVNNLQSDNKRADFAANGFDAVLSNEYRVGIKKLSGDSVMVSVNESGSRAGSVSEQELKLADGSEVLLKTAKSPEELYGQLAGQKIAELDRLAKESGRTREKMMEINSQIRSIKEESLAAQNKVFEEMAKQIEAVADDNQAGRAEIAAKMRAMAVNYKLTPIKLSELQLGEMVSLFSAQPIDWSKPVVIERLIVERE